MSCLENPKRIRSAYNFFSQDFYNSKTVENMTKDTINEMAQEWHNLSKEERQKYQQRTDEDRKRYERELERIKDYFRSYNLPPMLFKRGSLAMGVSRRATSVSVQHGGESERGGVGELPGGDARGGREKLPRSTGIWTSRWPSWRPSSRRCSCGRTCSCRRGGCGRVGRRAGSRAGSRAGRAQGMAMAIWCIGVITKGVIRCLSRCGT